MKNEKNREKKSKMKIFRVYVELAPNGNGFAAIFCKKMLTFADYCTILQSNIVVVLLCTSAGNYIEKTVSRERGCIIGKERNY